jgi:MscS family membrane protein
VLGLVVAAAGMGAPMSAGASDGASPLAPLDMSSPRATLHGFMATVDRIAANFREPDRGRAVREENARLLDRILRCLDLSAVPPSLAGSQGREAAVHLKEVLDRIELPPPDSIPDAAAVKADSIDRWRLPGTEIVLVRIPTTARAGDFVFSAETVSRTAEFFARVRGLPYRADAGSPGLFDAYVQLGGWMIPEWCIRALPSWAHFQIGRETVWQWLATCLVVAGAALATFAAWRQRRRARDTDRFEALERLLLPATLVAAGAALDYLLSFQIRLTGDRIVVAKIATHLLTLVGVVMGVLDTVSWCTETFLVWRRLGGDSIEGQLVRLASSVGRFLLVSWILIATADSFGVPVTPLVAGLGAGGLAIALASQYTVENLIAGLVIFADKPVRIGDECQYGSIRGRVERIGLRSTRIRGSDHALVSIPNAEFAKSQLVNYSNRTRIPLGIRLTLPGDQGPGAVRRRLDGLRELVASHPQLDHAASAARLGDPDAGGVPVQIDAIFLGSDERAAAACREALLLRALAIVAGEPEADAPARLKAA